MKVGGRSSGGTSRAWARCGATSGADFPLMVDANMRWSADEAVGSGARFLPHNEPLWLEEPTIP